MALVCEYLSSCCFYFCIFFGVLRQCSCVWLTADKYWTDPSDFQHRLEWTELFQPNCWMNGAWIGRNVRLCSILRCDEKRSPRRMGGVRRCERSGEEAVCIGINWKHSSENRIKLDIMCPRTVCNITNYCYGFLLPYMCVHKLYGHNDVTSCTPLCQTNGHMQMTLVESVYFHNLETKICACRWGCFMCRF